MITFIIAVLFSASGAPCNYYIGAVFQSVRYIFQFGDIDAHNSSATATTVSLSVYRDFTIFFRHNVGYAVVTVVSIDSRNNVNFAYKVPLAIISGFEAFAPGDFITLDGNGVIRGVLE